MAWATATQGAGPGLTPDRLEQVSSGLLMLLDRQGSLVQPPRPRTLRPQGSADDSLNAGLDPRVGRNLRLGDDPAALPVSLRAQAEPHLARDPHRPDALLATFQEGRFTDGGAVNCGYAVSSDGGLTWSRALIPGITPVAGGTYFRATDPVAGVDHLGRMFLNTLAVIDSTRSTSALLISRSTNGGLSFELPVEIRRSPNNTIFLDKNWMAINSFPGTPSAGRIVVTYTAFDPSYNPIARVYSNDGGRTWSSQALLTPSTSSCQGSQPVFLPDGRLAVLYWRFPQLATEGHRMEVVVSADGGLGFGAARLVANVLPYDAPGIRDGFFLPSAAANRTNATLYVVYQAYHLGAPRILFTRSTDAGGTWSAPQPISDGPAGTVVFNPAVAVSPDGSVISVVFQDSRWSGGNTNLVDVCLAQSFDDGATWEPNLRLSSVPSDIRLAPLTSSGYMLGDYLGIAPSAGPDLPAVPVWVDTRTGEPDPFVTRIGAAPALTFASWRAARFSLADMGQPAVTAPGADPDGDTVVNLLEYAGGLDPTRADSPDRRLALIGTGTHAALVTEALRVRGASDLTYTWLSSTNLTTWTVTPPLEELLIPSVNPHLETVSARHAVAAEGHRFHRLGVSLQRPLPPGTGAAR